MAMLRRMVTVLPVESATAKLASESPLNRPLAIPRGVVPTGVEKPTPKPPVPLPGISVSLCPRSWPSPSPSGRGR